MATAANTHVIRRFHIHFPDTHPVHLHLPGRTGFWRRHDGYRRLGRDAIGGHAEATEIHANVERGYHASSGGNVAGRLVLSAFVALFATCCKAEDSSTWWLQAGATDDHHGPVAPVGMISWQGGGGAHGSFHFAPEVLVGGIGSRSGDSRNNSAGVPFIGGGVKMSYGSLPLALTFSPVFNTQTNRYIGGHLNFVTELTYRYKHATFSIAHISNGGRVRPNCGENLGLVGWEF
jgi:hypothetical protein